jgi:hypothetical protein
METLTAKRAWNEVFWALNKNKFSARILFSAKNNLKLTEE